MGRREPSPCEQQVQSKQRREKADLGMPRSTAHPHEEGKEDTGRERSYPKSPSTCEHSEGESTHSFSALMPADTT